MEGEKLYGQTIKNMWENMQMIKKMVKGVLNGVMVKNMKDVGLMENNMEEDL